MIRLIHIRKSGTGFTLVELLVVISIIALLLSILMPSLRKARDQAHRVVCGSNLKSIGLATYLYASDNSDYLPLAYYICYSYSKSPFHYLIEGGYAGQRVTIPGGSPGKPKKAWEATKVWLCPGDKSPTEVFTSSNLYPNWTVPLGKYSYQWAAWLGEYVEPGTGGGWPPGWLAKSYNLAKNRFPSSVAMVRDKAYDGTPSTGYLVYGQPGVEMMFSTNHNDSGYNVLCVDLHVDWVNSETSYYWLPNDGSNGWR